MFRPLRPLFAHPARRIQAAAISRLQRPIIKSTRSSHSGAKSPFVRGDIKFQDTSELVSTETMHKFWGVVGEVEPLAYISDEVGTESLFVFCADGVYYWYSHGELKRFEKEGPFKDHDDFLERLGDKEVWGGGVMVDPIVDRWYPESEFE
ncbi:hypothetical protein B0H13DRAFT_2071000 [Mycena leptocephala]|nr:hypothetical protein B0H13DRAFT_2071000 [Mycena leptocephala]